VITASADFGVKPAPSAFDGIADSYDDVFTRSSIGQAQRAQVSKEFRRIFRPGMRVLEINCGTGVDALDLAAHGTEVVACDASSRMIEVARHRLETARLEGKVQADVRFEVLATERIGRLSETDGCFDGLLSNFAGLNCVESPASAARDLAALLKPGAPALLCLFGRTCAWEIGWYLAQGDFGRAFRRFSSVPVNARLGSDAEVTVSYPSVRDVKEAFAPYWRLAGRKAVGLAIPPTYAETWARRAPSAIQLLEKVENRISRWPILRNLGDHVVFEFERV
jgi:ubiquinone/menaquinone biosynthesis C-methylase UbiE